MRSCGESCSCLSLTCLQLLQQGTERQSPEGRGCFYPSHLWVFCAAQHWVSAGLMRHPHTPIAKQHTLSSPCLPWTSLGGPLCLLEGFLVPPFLSLSFPKLEIQKQPQSLGAEGGCGIGLAGKIRVGRSWGCQCLECNIPQLLLAG